MDTLKTSIIKCFAHRGQNISLQSSRAVGLITDSKISKRNDFLKLIAMVTMLIDHIGVLFFPGILIYRTIGRIAYPIFAYQISLGYEKTHSLSSYIKRLFIFAIISQFPYVFLNPYVEINLFHFNVIFLFLYAVMILWLYDRCSSALISLKAQSKFSKLLNYMILSTLLTLLIFLPLVLEIMIPAFVFSYSTYGILMILIFHVFRGQPFKILITYVLMSLINTYLKGGVYLVSGLLGSLVRLQTYSINLITRSDTNLDNILNWRGGLKTLGGYFFQLRSVLGLITIAVFEKWTPRFKMNKYVAYSFYPLHIVILLILRLILQ